jgi:hypothetical protein
MYNKKSFILYSDVKDTFFALTDDEAGKLIKHILMYVNDENPITDNRIIQIAFEPIKAQLKRDLKSWETTIEKRKESGKLGGLAKASKTKQNLANVANAKNTKQELANLAVNDNVNVNVNDNVNVIVNDNVINKNIPALKNKYLDSVTLSDSEYKKLLSKYAQHEVDWMIDCLNNYKMSSGMTYKSDYYAIRKWVIDAFEKAKKDFIKDNNTSEVRVATAMKAIENINWDDYTNQL